MPKGVAPLPELEQLGTNIEENFPGLPVKFNLTSLGGQKECFVALAGMRANRGGVLSWVARTMVYAQAVSRQEVSQLGAYLVRWKGIGLMPRLEVMESYGQLGQDKWIVAYSLDVLAAQTPPAGVLPPELDPAQDLVLDVGVREAP